ncbi:MAG: mannose-6-phosphate isomerase, class I [Spirochaetota bacterium]|nr:MAG: mannose-6-phosphate isomerase, class I [Spirochaetota bacterium]
MVGIVKLKNKIQEYTWGSKTAIAELMGNPAPSPKPQAELWMGAHPKAPSEVLLENEYITLIELIKKNPSAILGNATARKFSESLPFLFKVLAAGEPLSIQAHPTARQAKDGFQRENRENIPLDAYKRSYKDQNHKPEIISALTPFWAMSGFRPIGKMLNILNLVDLQSMSQEIDAFHKRPDTHGLKDFFESLMNLPANKKEKLVGEAVRWAEKAGKKSTTEIEIVSRWILRLNEKYPGDIGVLSPIILNLECLNPGDAMFTRAGVLHAYLEGVGIELMANSDNVLRGGLTEKNVDVPELLRILDYSSTTFKKIPEITMPNGEMIYDSPAQEFRLSRIHVNKNNDYSSDETRSAEIIICIEGNCIINDIRENTKHEVSKGDSILIPASVTQYTITGAAQLFKASVPL